MRRMPRGPKPPSINLSEKQQTILQKIEQSRQSVHSLVTRAKIVLQASTGERNQHIAKNLQVHVDMVRRWRNRWLEKAEWLQTIVAEGKEKEIGQSIGEALADEARSGAPGKFTAEEVCQIIAVACEVTVHPPSSLE